MRRTMVGFIVVLVLLSSLLVAFDIEIVEASDSNVNTYVDPGRQAETSIAVNPRNPDNIVIGFNDETTGEVRPSYTYTTDGGGTWTYGGSLPQGTLSNPPFCDPWLAFDSLGYLYYVAMSHVDREVFVCVGRPDGSANVGPLGFGDPQVVDDGSAGRNDKPAIAVDTTEGINDGNIYVVWSHLSGAGYYKIWFRRGRRTGPTTITWSEEGFQVSPSGELYTQGSQVAVGPNGEVYVAHLRMTSPSISDADTIQLSRSLSGGAPGTWTTGIEVSFVDSPEWFVRNTDRGARHASFPSLCVSSVTGTVFVAWTDDRNGDDDILLSRSTDDGNSWLSTPIRVNDDTLGNDKDQLHPAAVVSSGGVLDVVFYDRRDDTHNTLFNLYLARSWDEGDSWTNYIITDEPTDPDVFRWVEGGLGDYIGIASARTAPSQDRTFMAWADGRVGTSWPSDFNTDIFFDSRNVSALVYDPYFVIDIGRSPIRSCVPLSSCPIEISIQIMSIYDFQKEVELTASGLPAGSEYSFDNSLGVPPFETKLHLLFDPGVLEGKYEFSIRGSSDSLTITKLVEMELTNKPYIVLDTICADPEETSSLIGHGFTANASYSILFDGEKIQSGTVNSVGSLSTDLVVPVDAIEGNHTVTVDDGEGVQASTYLSTPRPETEEEAPPSTFFLDADGPYAADVNSPMITLAYSIAYGTPPYTVEIEWGDDSPIEIVYPPGDGTYVSTHEYPMVQANYVIRLTATDGIAESMDAAVATIMGAVYSPDDWPMFHHDLSNTGYSKSTGPNTNRTLWKSYYMSEAFHEQSPSVVDGKVYFVNLYYGLNCYDASTGTRIWNNSKTGGSWHSVPAVFGERVYIGTNWGFDCLDASTGTIIWSYTVGSGEIGSSPAVVSGRVYFGCADNNVYCLNAITGAKLWNYTTGSYVFSSPAVVDGRVYIGSEDHNVYCLNAITGAKLWSYTTGETVGSSPAVVDGRVYIGSGDNNVYCLNATSGDKIWSYTTGETVGSSPAVVDGRVYIGSGDNNVYCLNATSGDKIWSYTTAGPSPELAVADGKVYVIAGYVYCLNAVTGEEIWYYKTTSKASPAVSGGVLYFGATRTMERDGYLCAISDRGGGDWPMFHRDLTRSGNAFSSGPAQNFTLWTYDTGIGVSSSPAVVAGKIYFGSDDTLYCLNAFTGESVWNYTRPFPSGGFYSGPTVVGDRVYLGAWDWYIYCLDVSSGELVWSYRTENDVFSSPAVADGRVYIGSWDDWFYCLNASTGEPLWRYKTGYDIQWSSAAVADGRVYVGSMDNKLYCLDASTGTEIWNYTTGKYVHSSPALVDGKVYVGSADHKVYCLDALTGAQIWNYTTGDDILSSPAVANDRVYIGSADWNVYCLNATTGAQIWKTTTGNAVHSSPAIAGNRVYVGSENYNVYCFDALTGALIWKYKTEGPVTSSPAIAGGQVYIGSMDGTVYAFGSFTPSFRIEDNGVTHEISIASNSLISDFSFNQSSETIRFVATGTPDTPAFVNITFPTPLIDAPYTVLEDGSPLTPIESYNDTHTSLYIDYANNIHTFEIIGTIISGYPTISVDPMTLDFPQNYPMDYPALMNVTTITNVGDASLIVQSITLTLNEGATYAIDAIYREGRLGALFSMTPPFVLSPDQSAYVRVTFDPADIDPYMGTLEIVSNDPNNTITEVALTGDGGPPSCDYTCTGTVEWNAGDEEGNFEVTINVGGNITEHTLLTKFNILDPSFTPIDDNRRLVVVGQLEKPRLSGQMILEIWSTNSTEKLSVYNLIIEPYLQDMSVYTVNWNGYSFNVTIQSNSTICDFAFSQPEKRITFSATGPSDITGYCNVTIPKELLGGPYVCLLDGSPVTPIEIINSTHASLYITYTHDGYIQITGTTVIPEFPTTIITLLLLALLSLALLLCRREQSHIKNKNHQVLPY